MSLPANAYSPPKSPVGDRARRPVSPLKAVLAGLAIDVGGSVLIAALLAAGYAAVLVARGAPSGVVPVLLANLPPDSWVMLGSKLGGALCSLWGGYACARLAEVRNYRLGMILALVSSGLGVAMSQPLHFSAQTVLQVLTTVGFVLLGTRFGRIREAGEPS